VASGTRSATVSGYQSEDGAEIFMRLSYILARIAARAGIALWRNRFAWLVAALGIGALGVYELSYAGPGVVNGDCADTTMAALATSEEATARAAYACLSQGLRNTNEDTWVETMQHRAAPHGHVTRISDQRTQDGGHMVFFMVALQGQDVGYIVYLDSTGKVKAVE
jgi:hypothetical protein